MLPYGRIPIWENRRRVTVLLGFRQLADAYFKNLSWPSWMAGTTCPIENAAAKAARVDINLALADVAQIVAAAGPTPAVTLTVPPALGGYSQRVLLLENVFLLHQYQIPSTEIFDAIERALGVYDHDRRRSWIRTVNPFYWLGRAFDFVASAPFRLAERAGFNTTTFEHSAMGRLVKVTAEAVVFAAALVTLLYYIGRLDDALTLIGLRPSHLLPALPPRQP
jgi:hypothetical protein